MSRIDGALPEVLDAAGLRLVASKVFPPSPGVVARRGLVERTRQAGADLILVTAPAGYGKSTFLAELTRAEDRPAAWVSLAASEDDPAALLAYVALALDRIEPVDPRYVLSLWSRSPTIETPAQHAFGEMLARRQHPFTLVIDDVHMLRRRDSLDTLAALVTEMPAGSCIALASRSAIDLPLSRWRTRRRLVEVGLDDLAFDERETASLLDHVAVDADHDDVARLLERTEGWPVALYLAAIAHASRRTSASGSVADFTGEHRYLVEYFTEELLQSASADLARFLLEASCFESLSGSMCDDVLERTGSAQLLESARERNLLVIPLDDRREWYRFHHLIAQFLRTELERRDPARKRTIHRRASDWCHAHGDADGAVRHAVLSNDLDHAESLVIHWFGRYAGVGQNQTIEGWLELFSADELDAHPGVMLERGTRLLQRRRPGRCAALARPGRGCRAGPPSG